MQTGRETKHQNPLLGGVRWFGRAIMVWGAATGEAAPPMLEARAMPRMRAFEKLESEGRLRSSGLGVCQASTSSWTGQTYLYDGKAQDWGGNVTYPHA